MATQFIQATLPSGVTVDYEQDYEQAEAWMPDKAWSHIDANGHGHFHYREDDRYPTLEWVPEPCTMGHGDDCTSEGAYRCRQCGERVEPGRKWEIHQIPTMARYTLTVDYGNATETYVLTADDMNQLDVSLKRLIRSTLVDCRTSTEHRIASR